MTHKLNLRDVRAHIQNNGKRITNNRLLKYEAVHGPITHMHCNCCHEEHVIEDFSPRSDTSIRRNGECRTCQSEKEAARAQRNRDAQKCHVKPMNAYGCRTPQDPTSIMKSWRESMGGMRYGLPNPTPKPIHGPGPCFTR